MDRSSSFWWRSRSGRDQNRIVLHKRRKFKVCTKVRITIFGKNSNSITCGLSEDRLLSICSNITLEVEGGFLDFSEGATSLESSPETLVVSTSLGTFFFCFFFEADGEPSPTLGSFPVVLGFRFFGVVGGSLLV